MSLLGSLQDVFYHVSSKSGEVIARRVRNCSSKVGPVIVCSYEIPLVADIHFAPTIANQVAECFDKIRINPGNFGKVLFTLLISHPHWRPSIPVSGLVFSQDFPKHMG
jgi:hypothetical protein